MVRHGSSTEHLEKHGQLWRVSIGVPKDLQRILGKTRLKRSLGTRDLAVANRLKTAVIDQLQAELDQARGQIDQRYSSVMVEASRLRQEFLQADLDSNDPDFRRAWGDRYEQLLGIPTGYEVASVEENGTDVEVPFAVYPRHAQRLADDYASIATGQRTPFRAYLETYVAERKATARTKSDDIRAVKFLEQWCVKEGIPNDVNAIDEDVALRFADDLAVFAGGISTIRVKKYVGLLRKYWSKLKRQKLARINPWLGVEVEGEKLPAAHKERKFEAEELRRLLVGEASQEMHDLMRIAALTGARIEAIVSLTVGDIVLGAFRFRPQKEEGKGRDVPIHPDLTEIVERRTRGRALEDEFFPEWPYPKKGMREKSFKASNRFTEYRRSCGVEVTVPGKRRSLVNFHSFRRWFSTMALRTGVHNSIASAIVGHAHQGNITLDVYSAGPAFGVAKAVVDAIRLPPLDVVPAVEERSLAVVLPPAYRATAEELEALGIP